MILRTVVTAFTAALAVTALSVPVGHAQTDTADPDAGSAGSLSGLSGEGSGDSAAAPAGDEVCQLPSLGGSVAKFYPLVAIDGMPTGVIDLVTSALDSFPNLLDVVAGEGGGAALLAQTGSLGEGLCSSIFGGDMVLPPVTVIVDEEGAPVTTVTGSVNTNGSGSASGGSSSGSGATSAPTSVPTPAG